MDTMTALKTRRSNGSVTAEPISKDLLEELLQASAWAPNHHRTDPWRFAVFMGAGRQKLGAVLAEGTRAANAHLPEAERAALTEKAETAPLRAPVVVAVWAAVGRGPAKNPPAWEDHAAVAAAVQNLLLAAHAKGLAGFWRTGPYGDLPTVQALLGLDTAKGDKVLGLVYLGHPDPTTPEPLRPTPDWKSRTVWHD